jgi:hypothetical protein
MSDLLLMRYKRKWSFLEFSAVESLADLGSHFCGISRKHRQILQHILTEIETKYNVLLSSQTKLKCRVFIVPSFPLSSAK